MLQLALLGPFRVTLDGEPVADLATDKVRALLAFLAVEAARPHRRDALAGLLWPDQPQDRARQSLRQALSNLRRAIGDRDRTPPLLQTSRNAVQFNPTDDLELDVTAFTCLVADCRAHRHRRLETCLSCMRRLERAVALYQGNFLEGFFLSDSAIFEEWAVLKREWLHLMAVEALSHLAVFFERRGEYGRARRYAWRQVELEPWREEAHRQLMRVLALTGQRSAALVQYESCRRTLSEELGVEPTQETQRLYEHIRTGKAFEPAPRHSLPPSPTPFVGRQEELAELADLLADPDCHLVTVVGPGGIGKTRLALQAAQEQVGAFAHGVHFVPLAAVSSVKFMLSALADALNFSFQGRQDPQEQLLNYLREKEMLLVLDNLEHLLDGCALLAAILRRAPGIVLLVTSQERLNLQEEWVYEVRGLSYPTDGVTNRLDDCSAIQLFLQSARRARQGWTPAEREMAHVVRICQVVEGMPLGLELAAAWAAVRPVEDVAREIEESLDVLSTVLRNVPRRHRSIQATFEHSWNLLVERERRVLARLSVFRGGFEREAAEQVAGASLSVLMTLVHKSLLRCDVSGRYQMHQLLRQFAAEKLAGQPEAHTIARDRHCTYYAGFLKCQETALAGADTTQALAAMKTELENVRAAWGWAVSRKKLPEIEHSLGGLARFYLLRGPFEEGEALIEAAIDAVRGLTQSPGQNAQAILAKLLIEQARFLNAQAIYERAIAASQAAIEIAETGRSLDLETAGRLLWGQALWLQGNYRAAQTRLERALMLARTASLRQFEAESLLTLGSISLRQGDYAQARVHFDQAWDICNAMGDRRGESDALNSLGAADYYQGNHAAARASFEKALRIRSELGDQRGKAKLLSNLGNCAAELGDYTEARLYYQQALCINREIGHRRGESNILNNLAALFWSCGEYEKARDYYGRALHIYREIGDRQGVGLALSNQSLLFHLLGNHETALDRSQQALRVAQELGDEPVQGQALTRLGYALAGLGCLSEAEAALQQALALRRELGIDHLAMETQAGLARVSLASGDLAQARARVEEILDFLETNTLDGTDEPFRVYLTCYRVLRAGDDPRATRVLSTARRSLREQAAKISDEKLRRSFLENVAVHREILAASIQVE